MNNGNAHPFATIYPFTKRAQKRRRSGDTLACLDVAIEGVALKIHGHGTAGPQMQSTSIGMACLDTQVHICVSVAAPCREAFQLWLLLRRFVMPAECDRKRP